MTPLTLAAPKIVARPTTTLTALYDLRVNDKIVLDDKSYIITAIASRPYSWSGRMPRDRIYGTQYTIHFLPIDYQNEAIQPSTQDKAEWDMYYEAIDRDRRRRTAATKIYVSQNMDKLNRLSS